MFDCLCLNDDEVKYELEPEINVSRNRPTEKVSMKRQGTARNQNQESVLAINVPRRLNLEASHAVPVVFPNAFQQLHTQSYPVSPSLEDQEGAAIAQK